MSSDSGLRRILVRRMIAAGLLFAGLAGTSSCAGSVGQAVSPLVSHSAELTRAATTASSPTSVISVGGLGGALLPSAAASTAAVNARLIAVTVPFAVGTDIMLTPPNRRPPVATNQIDYALSLALRGEARSSAWLAQARDVTVRFGTVKASDPDFNGATGYYVRIANGPFCYENTPFPHDAPPSPSAAGELGTTGTPSNPESNLVLCTVGVFQATDGSSAAFTVEGTY